MFKKVDYIFSYDEIVKFIKAFLTSIGYESLNICEKEYTSSPVYGIDIKHKWMHIYRIKAPFNIGEINIDIFDDRISFKYIWPYKRYFNDELGLNLYGPVVDMKQDAWYMVIPGLKTDDYYWNYKYGGFEGCQINSYTMKYIIEFLNTIFIENKFECSEDIQYKAKEYINQLDDYSKNYSKTAYRDLLKLIGLLWHNNKYLWSCIPKFMTRHDDLVQHDILRINDLV